MNKVVADNRQRVVELIRATAASLGSPDELVTRVIERMRPSVRLIPHEGPAARVGASKAGGTPDLPEGMDWPLLCPEDGDESPFLSFVLQTDLAEVAPWDVEGLLPREGLLSVFVCWEDDYFDERPYFLFHVFPPSGPPLHRAKFPRRLPKTERFREVALEARPEWTVPSPEDAGEVPFYESRHLRLWGDVGLKMCEVQGNPDYPTHRLLGHPQLMQSPGVADGTRLLLQVDSDYPGGPAPKTGMRWGGNGRLYVMLDEADLRAGRWAEVWAFAERC